MLDAIGRAEHHVHIEFFIFRPDDSGRRFIDALTAAARRGVEVRFLYDAVGSFILSAKLLRELKQAGGRAAAFLPPFNPLYRMRINLRNHRKILVVDGKTAFTGGLNIGDEYLGKARSSSDPGGTRTCGSTARRWSRCSASSLRTGTSPPRSRSTGPATCPRMPAAGDDAGAGGPLRPGRRVQGDPRDLRRRHPAGAKRVWIASPYFVPDAGLRDALVLAGRSGLDVRFLGLFRPDKWLPFLAARYYWARAAGGRGEGLPVRRPA